MEIRLVGLCLAVRGTLQEIGDEILAVLEKFQGKGMILLVEGGASPRMSRGNI